ncbi:hypothetical protein HEP81_08126 (plasmid) [Streptomyces griseofuscus]|uniref:Uncharacterized protein n=1 Tax=Streptomyces griseofuscus TaxID=146922 RepID=A0A7H1QDH4_9ACTN|nr:hypothetical protein [Streptomyces griseofuscus]QNT98354.1 hypothetical protein HEP81_08126 [Streptomyces griseofuscus]
MAKNTNDRAAWVEAQADALYEAFLAKEAAAQASSTSTTTDTTTVQGDRHGITGGTHHGDLYFDYKG